MRDLQAWVEFIQQRIVAHSVPTPDPNHSATDMVQWVHDLACAIVAEWPDGWETWTADDPRAFDENMRLAREMGLILCAWDSSVHRAKAQDPARPIAHRRGAHERRIKWIQQLVTALVDDRHDPTLFPVQRWE